jgi:hypothetical protein
MQDLAFQFFSALQHVPPADPPAVTGLLSGVIGSFVADWSKWGFESRRYRRETMSRLIEQARSVLAEPPPKEDFREKSLYLQLSPHLLATTRAKMIGTLLPEGREVIEIELRGN